MEIIGIILAVLAFMGILWTVKTRRSAHKSPLHASFVVMAICEGDDEEEPTATLCQKGGSGIVMQTPLPRGSKTDWPVVGQVMKAFRTSDGTYQLNSLLESRLRNEVDHEAVNHDACT